MKKQDIQKIFKHYDITLTELKEVYGQVIREAKKLWKEEGIQEDFGKGIGRLYAQVGFNQKEGLMGRADWHFSGWSGETEVWYYALKINLLDDAMDYTAANASDYLYEDPYYRRTGQISQKALNEASKNYPLDFKTFEEVVVGLAEGLLDRMG